MDRLDQLLSDTFSPYTHHLGPARPDGGRVLTLKNAEGETVLRRVIASEHLGDARRCEEAIQTIGRDLAVQEGRIGEEVIQALRQRAAQVLNYDA
ncbi:DUF3509 domain-containing protein [Pseudomonas panipatensis]|jgi:hypothetical protein|uniref:DUF3509 domain-containing protein n=1 Tax=Pseudomonas panipatensis TaxID=428992 RepID=A0A1G8DSS2_9PSED|nr:DUF3509 domain-containing protein [Pseudomonas panipatensis]SDH60469.1 Protein of unknown function [Pseudomonas panipatensis]SMP40010.1 Protein of unknown function [Pseudomonas panipatensis]